jgi:hypothetical protein
MVAQVRYSVAGPSRDQEALCAICTMHLKTKVNGLSVVWPQNHWDGFLWFGLKAGGFRFPGLGLKTDSSDLMIWASKSPRRFLGMCLKTKQALVYWLRHKTDGGRTAWDMR